MNGDMIFSYARKEAIQDGILIDVTETAKEAGVKFPTAVTKAVWETVVTPDEEGERRGESESGRLWDVLWMFSLAARRSGGGSILHYPLIVTEEGKQKEITLKAVIGPGDQGEPVITIMFPNES